VVIALDTAFLLDYLDGVPATRAFLESHEQQFTAPSVALFEVYRGAARTGGREALTRVNTVLEWIDPLVLDDATAREAAVIESELLDAGQRINLGDVLIAGICRHHGASIVTRDADFDRVEELDTLSY
jgi:predicted nucleic acid-binding protein